MTVKTSNPETMGLHAGPRSDATTGAVAVPIYQTTSYEFRNTEHAANLFALKDFGNIYSRIMNPTCDVLEQRDRRARGRRGGTGRQLRAGGIRAVDPEPVPARRQHRELDRSLRRHLEPVRQHAAVHGHHRALRRSRRPRGVPSGDGRTHASLLRRDTPQSQAHRVPDRRGGGDRPSARRAADHGQHSGARSCCRPFEHGAAIIVHSTTKYIGGHGTSIGGIIVDGGNFDWAAHKQRFPTLNEADPSYHGGSVDRGHEADGPRRLHHPRPGRAAA